MSVCQLGLVLGPLVGGSLTQYVTWRWCTPSFFPVPIPKTDKQTPGFYINLPPGGLVALLLFLIKIPSKNTILPTAHFWRTFLLKLDLIGFCLFAPFAVQFLLALQWGGTTHPWKSATIIGLFCGAFATLCVWATWNYRKGEDAMVPFSAMRRRIVWASCAAMFFFFGSVMVAIYYLPIYFQTVRNATPTLSGVYLLPTIIPQLFLAIISGALVGRMGYYLPWLAASGALMAIAMGLFSTFDLHTSTGKWIGYQILGGVGRGMGIQMPLIAIQNNLPPKMISIGMAMVVFCQTFGGALMLALAETNFTSSLKTALPKYAPGVSAQKVLMAGATNIRKDVPPELLDGVLEAYAKAINNVFYFGAAITAMVFVCAWGTGWKSIKKVKKVKTEEAAAAEEGQAQGGAEKATEKEVEASAAAENKTEEKVGSDVVTTLPVGGAPEVQKTT